MTITAEPAVKKRTEAYFDAVTRAFAVPQRADVLAITHLLADRPYFLDALAAIADVRAVLPKPRSIDPVVREELSTRYRCDDLDRDRFTDPETSLRYIEDRARGRNVVLLDVGGYFAPTLAEVCRRFSGRILGWSRTPRTDIRNTFGSAGRHARCSRWRGAR